MIPISRPVRRLVGASLCALGMIVGRAAAGSQDGCRCATTFQGTGATRVVVCEGFNPQNHGRCECEQIQVNQQTGCRPVDTARSPDRNPTPRPGRNG